MPPVWPLEESNSRTGDMKIDRLHDRGNSCGRRNTDLSLCEPADTVYNNAYMYISLVHPCWIPSPSRRKVKKDDNTSGSVPRLNSS